MSVDNYLLIKREQNSWVGYIESASLNEPTLLHEHFRAGSLEEAVVTAQNTDTEYGIQFDLGDESNVFNELVSLDTAWTLEKLS